MCERTDRKSEPLNPRAEDLLARHHIETEGYETVALSEEEFGEDTLVLAMQDSIKQKIQNDYPGKGQVYTLCEFVNGSKEIPSVYGQTQEQYEQMYELIGIESEKKEEKKTFEFRPLGKGLQDFPAILAAAEDAGAEWVVVEQDAPSMDKTPMECAEISIAYLKTLL